MAYDDLFDDIPEASRPQFVADGLFDDVPEDSRGMAQDVGMGILDMRGAGRADRKRQAEAAPAFDVTPMPLDEFADRAKSAAGGIVQGAGRVFSSVPKAFAIEREEDRFAVLGLMKQIDSGELDEKGALNAARRMGLPITSAGILQSYARAGEDSTDEAGPLAASRRQMREELLSQATLPQETDAWKAGEAIDDYLSSLVEQNPEYAEDFFTGKLPQGVGSALGFMAQAALLRGPIRKLGLPGTAANAAAVAASGSMMGAVDGFETALNEGATIEEAFQASDIMQLVGITEAVPLAGILDRIDRGSGGTISKALKDMLKEGSEEAAQEAFQTIMQNLVASDLVGYDPERGMWVDAEEGAAVGFTTGAILSLLGSMLGARRMRGSDAQPDKDATDALFDETGRTRQDEQGLAGQPADQLATQDVRNGSEYMEDGKAKEADALFDEAHTIEFEDVTAGPAVDELTTSPGAAPETAPVEAPAGPPYDNGIDMPGTGLGVGTLESSEPELVPDFTPSYEQDVPAPAPAAPFRYPPSATIDYAPTLPSEFADPRLADDVSRDMLVSMGRELVKGGGITLAPRPGAKPISNTGDLIYDFGAENIIRTSSLNPEWAQSLMADEGMSVEQVQGAIDRAVKGKPLGTRQQRVIERLLDMVDERRAEDAMYDYMASLEQIDPALSEQVSRQRVARRDALHYADATPETMTLAELGELAIDAGVPQDAVFREFEREVPDADVARNIASLIQEVQRGREAETAAATGQTDGPRPDQGQAPARADRLPRAPARGTQGQGQAVAPPAAPAAAPPATEVASAAVAPVQSDRRHGERAAETDRRANPAMREAYARMSPDEAIRAIWIDPMTGLGNKRAYEEFDKLPWQASVDVDTLKWINDNLGHEAGDELLKAVGDALGRVWAESYHISGDEFVLQGTDSRALRDALQEARDILKGVVVEGTLPDGAPVRVEGVGISFGIDRTLREADRKMAEQKEKRTKQGERAARGEAPPTLRRLPDETARFGTAAVDLFGDVPVAQQAMADAARAKDAKRNGTEAVPVEGHGDLFEPNRGKQVDIEDLAGQTRAADTIDVDGVARPRTDSSGQPIAATDEALRNFWRWFGDSKVVDEQGRPLVVYHGTAEDFDAFRNTPNGAFFFEDKELAELYGKPVPAYLSLKNPAIVDAQGQFWNEMDAVQSPVLDELRKHVPKLFTVDHIKQAAQKAGYDGAIILNTVDNGGAGNQYIAFRPEQIKSATGNRGTFDGSNPDIRFSLSPEQREREGVALSAAAPHAQAPTAADKAAAKKLRAAADKLEASATDKLNQNRLTNTHRRASMAAAAENAARADIEFARTMRNVADAIEEGRAPHLAKVRAKTHLAELEKHANRAKFDAIRASRSERYDDARDRPLQHADLAYVEYPRVWSVESAYEYVAAALDKIKGKKGMAAKVRAFKRRADEHSRVYLSEDEAEVMREAIKTLRDNGESYIGWQFDDELKGIDRLKRLGINNTEDLRAALTELVELQGEQVQKDRAKELERRLVGTKIPGFFPTPAPVIERMMDEAAVGPGMDVLEPSAGTGNIAVTIREQIPDAAIDTIEINTSLREVLAAKGFEPVADDFLAYDGKQYDRIIMNPPFENNQDIEHVRHAYDLLKPGGRLVSVMSEGPFFRSDKAAEAFRDWFTEVGGWDQQVESGAFMDRTQLRTTGVATRIVTIEKPRGIGELRPVYNAGPRPVRVRTNFFGDARSPLDILREKATRFARHALIGNTFVNESTGMAIRVSRNSIRKTLSHGNKIDHVVSVGALPDLLRHARLVMVEPDRRGRPEIQAVRKFEADIRIDDREYKARLTVRQLPDGQWFYDHVLLKKQKPDGSASDPSAPSDESVRPASGSHASTIAPHVEAVKDAIRSRVGRAFDRMLDDGSLVILDYQEELPPRLYRKNAVIQGVHDPVTGKSYLIAGNIPAGRAFPVFMHEVGVHHGLRAMLGDKAFDGVLQDVEKLVRSGNKRARRAAARVPEWTEPHLRTEETLAYLVEDAAAHRMPVVKRLLAKVRAWLIAHGFRMKHITTDDLVMLTVAAIKRNKVQSAVLGRDNGARYMVAYHGTPHEFDAFSMERIGSGEGAQAYGYGLYFTESREIAEYYRSTLAAGAGQGAVYEVDLAPREDEYLLWDEPLAAQSDVVQDAIRQIAIGRSAADFMDAAREDFAENGPSGYSEERFERAMAEAFESGGYGEEFGSDVWDELREAAPNTDWSAVENGQVVGGLQFDWSFDDGASLYRALSGRAGNQEDAALMMEAVGIDPYGPVSSALTSEHLASLYLRALGVRGIKYRDATSRTTDAEDRSYNYVLFDENDVKILARYSVAEDPEAPVYEVQEVIRNTGIAEPGEGDVHAAAGVPGQLGFFFPEDRPQEPSARVAAAVRQVTVGTFYSGIDTVRGPEDVAHIVAPLRKSPQEHVLAVVTDEDGRVLSIIRHQIGTYNGAGVEPAILAGSIHDTEDAAYVWMAHNHPAGNPEQSAADHNITRQMRNLLAGTGVELKGMVVVAPGNRMGTHYHPDWGESEFQVPARVRRIPIPVKDRAFRKIGVLENRMIKNPDDGARYMKSLEEPSGILLLNNRHFPVAWMPMSERDMVELRGDHGRARALFRAINQSNAASIMIKIPEGSTDQAYRNVISFARDAGIQPLDAFSGDRSMASVGLMDPAPSGDYGYYSIAEDQQDALRAFPTQEPLFEGFDVPAETLRDALLRKLQDRFRRVKTVQHAIRDAGNPIPEASNAYLAEELYYGKTENALRRFGKTHVEPLIKEIADSKVSLEELGLYLYARHAPERNARIAEINPELRGAGVPGSGMSDATAAKILDAFEEEGKTKVLEHLARRVYAINSERLRLLADAGLESPETLASWQQTYERYVPLRGFREEAPDTKPRIGRGFDIRGRESKRALGRMTMAENPVVMTVMQMEEAIIRAEKNAVGRAFLNLVLENPNDNLWTVTRSPLEHTMRRFNPETGEVERISDPRWKLGDNVLSVKVDGDEYYIEIKDDVLARTMKRMGVDTSNAVIRAMAAFNRYLAAINTAWSPEFVVSNFARDLQTAMINLVGEQDAKGTLREPQGMARKVLKDMPNALRGAYAALRDENASGEWVRWFNEYRDAGGKIGFFGLEDIDTKRRRLEGMLREARPDLTGMTLSHLRALRDWIEDVNGAVENGVRLATYANARRAGLSKAHAASLARNLTVNFNRKGELGPMMNALYLFYNASLQGGVRLLYAMRSPKVRKVLAGIAASAFALAELNRFLAGDDDDDGENDYDAVPDHVKQRNLILWNPLSETPGDYFKIPLPYGYNVPYVFGESLNAVVHGREKMRAVVQVFDTVLEAFNPLGTADSDSLSVRIAKQVSPTLLDPVLEIAVNEDFAGRPIMPERFPFGPGQYTPNSALHWRGVDPTAKAIAEALNSATGGNPAKSGLIDISPEHIEHVRDFLTGSLGRVVADTVNLPYVLTTEGKVPAYKVPFVRRFYGEQGEYHIGRRYYEHAHEIGRVLAEWEYWKRSEDKDAARAWARENAAIIKLEPSLKRVESRLSELRKLRHQIEVSPVYTDKGRREALDKVNAQITDLQRRFNKLFNEAVRDTDQDR